MNRAGLILLACLCAGCSVVAPAVLIGAATSVTVAYITRPKPPLAPAKPAPPVSVVVNCPAPPAAPARRR